MNIQIFGTKKCKVMAVAHPSKMEGYICVASGGNTGVREPGEVL